MAKVLIVKEMGSVYKVEKGTLFCSELHKDGSYDKTNWSEVANFFEKAVTPVNAHFKTNFKVNVND